MTSISTFLPPSPTDLSSPPTRKGSNLQIDTTDSSNDITAGNNFWKSQSNLFSPPLSPLTSFYNDRPMQSNTTRKKSQQPPQQPPTPPIPTQQVQPQPQQSQQQSLVLWQTNWKDIDIQTLTLENAKLQRANRLLKVDRENWLEKRLKPLDQHIRELTVTNVRWQRAAKLLQQDVEEAQQQLADWKHYQVTRIPQMDPEYQFLVNMIYHLQSQINGRTTCKEKDGIISKPRSIDHAYYQEISEDGSRKASYSTCSTVSNQEINWDELSVLVDKIHLLEQNLETTLQQLSQKNHVVARLESEVQKKDQLMARLEKDFDEMNDQLQSWQHVIENGLEPSTSDARAPPNNTTTTEMEMIIEDGPTTITTSSTTSSLDQAIFTLHDSIDDVDDSNHDDIFESDENCDSDPSLLTGNMDEGYEDDEFDNLTCDLPTTAKTTSVSPSLTCHLEASNANTTSAEKAHRRTSSSGYSTSSTTTIACCDDDDKHHQRCITYSTTSSQNTTSDSTSSSSSSSLSTSISTSSINEQRSIPARHSPYPLATAQFTHQFPSIFTTNASSTILLPGSYPCHITANESLTTLSLSSTSTTLSSTYSSDMTTESKNIHWTGNDNNNNNNNGVDDQERLPVLRALVMGHEPYAPFALMSLFLGLSTKMGINEDWLIPITLLALFSGYLWRGAFCGIRIKVNI